MVRQGCAWARIVNGPVILSIDTLRAEPDQTYVTHGAIPPAEAESSEITAEVAQMLKGVAEGAVS